MNCQLEVGPLSRQSDVATPIRPITGRHSLSPVSSSRWPVMRPRGRTCPRGGGSSGFACFAQVTMNGLVPAYTPVATLSVLPNSEWDNWTTSPFGWSLTAPWAPLTVTVLDAVHICWTYHPA